MALKDEITLPSLLNKLKEAGYETLEEIKESSVYDLTQELELNTEEVKFIIKVSGKETKVKRTVTEIIAAERENSISTSSKNFDKLLEHGVPPFKITEICGESGSGKTQLCMQLAVNVQLEKSLGGVQGDCIYIDTEGSFQSSRIIRFAKKHNIEHILKGIHLFRVLDHFELTALVRQLPDILMEYTNVKLIIIDSIAYHFRVNTMDIRSRTSILDYIARCLIEIANVNQLSVVVTNHVTTDGIDNAWTPSLGSSWGYWCANRLFLYRKREYRYGYLYKSIENAGSQPVPFCIKEDGIVDPEQDELELHKQENETEAEINDKIDLTWEEIKNQKIKDEQDMFDDFWDEGLPIENIEPQPTIEMDNNNTFNVSNKRHLNNSHDDNVVKKRLKVDEELSEIKNPVILIPITKDSIPSDEQTANKTFESQPNNDNQDSDSNYWASDIEQELDLDFLENIQSYF